MVTAESKLLVYIAAVDVVTQHAYRQELISLLDALQLRKASPPTELSTEDIRQAYFRYFPYLHRANQTGLLSLHSSTVDVLARMHLLYKTVDSAIQQENRLITTVLDHAGISPIFFKGRELQRVCNDLLRISGDTDYLVSAKELEHTQRCLDQIGYRQGLLLSKPLQEIFDPRADSRLRIRPIPEERLQAVRTHHHHLHPYYRIIEVPKFPAATYADAVPGLVGIFKDKDVFYALSCIDLHFNIAVGVCETDYSHFLQDLTPTGLTAKLLPPEVIFWFLCGRCYYEPLVSNQQRFADLIDAMMVMYTFRCSLDWDWVLFLGSKYQATAALYYVLCHFEALLSGLVPNQVFPYLEQRLAAQPEFDLGDFLPKAFGVVKYGEEYSRLIHPLTCRRNREGT